MFKQIIGRSIFPARTSLHFSLLLLPLLWVQLTHSPNIQASTHSSSFVQWSWQRLPPNTEIQNTQAVTALEPGKAIERELSGGQKHEYQIKLAEGQYISLMVEQRGIDVVVRLLSPNGKLITDCDSVGGPQGVEDPGLVAEAAGNYIFEVVAKRKDAPVGRYEIKITELRAATETDRLLLQAQISYGEARKLNNQEEYDLALPPAQRAAEIYEKVLGQHARTATSLRLVGFIFLQKSQYAAAEPFFQRAVEIGEKALPSGDLSLASNLNALGLNNLYRGNYEKAETLLQRAVRMFETAPDDPQYPKIGHVLHSLGFIYYLRGDYAKLQAANQRALTIWEKAYGADSIEFAGTLSSIADDYRISGDYVQAESLLLRAVAIAEKAAVDRVPAISGIRTLPALEEIVGALADLYTDKGDYGKAEALLGRQQAIVEKFGPDYPYLPDFLDNLVAFNRIKGDFEKAEQLSLRAIAIRERVNGTEHFLVAHSLNILGTLYYYWGESAKAEPVLYRALAISQKALGTENPTAASILNMLGNVYRARGDYSKAESLYQDALAINENLFGPNYPELAKTLDNLATLSAAEGDGAQAIKSQARANEIDEHNISLNLTTGSERQKLVYLRTLSDKVDKTISLQLRFAPDDPRAREQAVALVLQRKGRVQDAMTNSLSSLRRYLSVEDQELLGDLNATNTQLAQLVLEGSQQIALAEQHNRIKTLEAQKEKLEADISLRSAGFYQQSQPVTFAAIHSAVPDNAALIELAVYRPFDPKANDAKAYGEPRYVAYVLRRQGEVQWKGLGEAKAIDGAIDELRQALRDPQRKDVRQLARAVDEKVMQPVRGLLGDAKQLLISPDGELNLIPFAALVDEQGRYLIERYAFTYLTSGRDLLRMPVAREARSKPLVIANPTFGEPATELLAKATKPTPPNNRRRSVTTGSDLAEVYFAPLSGTAQEARSIQTLFPDANILTGAQATESAVKQINAPRILHLATHGFFLSEPGADRGPRRGSRAGVVVATGSATARGTSVSGAPATASVTQISTRGISASAKIENPLLRSGLALAGANLRGGASDDGILTALEASGLNLWGTKLVVLSACDTGLGEVKNGEGVYGLRRAFVLAGAESMIMSLWPVSDYATRRLMTSYYKNLKQGMGRGAALRQVQLDMLRQNRQLHPFYWANFIQSGEWANLDGKR